MPTILSKNNLKFYQLDLLAICLHCTYSSAIYAATGSILKPLVGKCPEQTPQKKEHKQ